mmetsp:Transcript_1249/g.1271  ORF Transcript_1249/g.1271 Transcript_1249/m.1271 type:complete len:1427 (+) Transcript_1249:173-4453(+)
MANNEKDSHNLESLELKPQRRLLSFMLSKKVPPLPLDEERKLFPEKRVNFLSRIFFWWLFPVLNTGYKRTLKPEDMFKLTDDIRIETMYARFSKILEESLKKAKKKHLLKKCNERGENLENSSVDEEDDMKDFKLPKPLTVFALLKTFKWQYIKACLYLALANGGMTANPLQTKKLISYVEMKAVGYEIGIGKGLGYSFGSAGVVLVTGILINHFFYNSMLTGAEAKAVLTKAILDKSFKTNAETKHKYPAGKVTSMMGTDLARIDFAIGFQPFLFTFPVPIAIAIGILIYNVGPTALVGIGLLFVFMVAITISTKKLFEYRSKANSYTDSRVDYIKEVLNNLRIIKFYSWEPPYHENISNIRREEMKIIYRMQVLRNIIVSFAMSMTLFSSLVTFLVLYAIKSNDRDPASIFSSISLFNILSQQVIMLPMALATGVDAFIGLQRVGAYLASGEIDEEANRTEARGETLALMEDSNTSIEIRNASFEWDTFEDEESSADGENKEVASNSSDNSDSSRELTQSLSKSNSSEEISFPGLRDINLSIKKSEFVVITGLIGSGKSSLLSAMSGFMRKSAGEINVNGSLLLCGYPWVQNETVRENVLFGSKYDEEKYKNVIYACSLESDLEILPAGDNTEIGERGITLSGGQKARINLARAVYADKDIVLLDDVLSAVDARVGKHIMNNCMLGLLKDKTRILATHQLSLIGTADRIIFLNGDGTIDVGTLEELSANNADFKKLMTFNSQTDDSDDEDEEEVVEDEEIIENEKELIQRQLSKTQTHKSTANDDESIERDYNKNNLKDGKLFEEEEKAVNGISFDVYKNYIKHGSGIFKTYGIVPVIISAVVLATFCQLFTNTWLSFWTENRFPNRPDRFYIGFYVMFTILAFTFLTLEFVLLAYMTNRASRSLNVIAVNKVLHAPMSFMDTTPMGRILNRFTKDTDVLDNEIGDQLRLLFFMFSNIVGVLILCICYLPWFAIAVPFLVFVFVAVANYYQSSAREIKRLEAVQRSHVYNNFNETLNGMNTIKAYRADNRFLEKNDRLINKMNEAYYMTIANQRWLAIQLDIVASLFALLIALLCVNRIFNISASSVGLLLSYVLQIAGQLSMLIRTFTQVENEMNSVERICNYAYNLPEEAPYFITETTPHPEWPQKGGIKFDNASMAYRPGLPLVLKDLNLDIKPTEKVGICGRTGAGKSSIMTALYRLSELESGKILIDDVDISRLGLKDLRSCLSIIPQDPILFRGTIRTNLDPFGDHQDEKLWDALRRSGLIDDLRMVNIQKQDKENDVLNKFHLDQNVEDEGSNFSLGERQLIAFARALVRDSKILILDEATSSVDYETDSKIQSTIVREFADCTILCIAHRLKTILHYDRILVLDRGEVKEFDTPLNLFNMENSIFQQMCQRSNIVLDDFRLNEQENDVSKFQIQNS